MKELITYEFYKDKYYGECIDESAFPKWLSKATDKLNFLTHGNITDDTLVKYNTQIQKATCALMDLLFQIEEATKRAAAKDETNIKSKSSGAESVTFGDTQTLVMKVLNDKAAQNRLLYETVCEYLIDTGLMYAGV